MHITTIAYCILGQHEEGVAMRTELNDLWNRLQNTFPTLANLIEIESRRDIAKKSWVTLLANLQLQCHHQDESWGRDMAFAYKKNVRQLINKKATMKYPFVIPVNSDRSCGTFCRGLSSGTLYHVGFVI